MAAYAALVSLINAKEQILDHPRHSTSLDKYQIESLGEKVDFLLDFIESYNSHGGSKEAEDLESQIASAAHAAEDVIESHVVDQILAGSTKKSLRCLFDLQKIIDDMDSIKEKVMKVKEGKGFKDQRPIYSMPAASSRPLTTGKTTMVGFDDELMELMDRLTGQQTNRLIIPMVGMGGIGKTTLARNVYENLVVVQYFDIRAWGTVSQQYNVKEILLELLFCQKKQEYGENFVAFKNEMDEKTEEELGEQLYKILCGKRYLIILDDVWSIEAWDKIKFFFPNNNNKQRIVVTTRLPMVAIHFGSPCFVMTFLNEDKSWDLFCEKAFGQEGYPPELEEIGKKIAKKCKGLPLAIVVIGGLLGNSYKTQEYWVNVAKDVKPILDLGEDEQCWNILSLSYTHLPIHLKPCFLYMGIFPEDREIRVSQLIKLWVAEGFLKPNKAQNAEEVAEDYLKDLVDRNLILVRRMRSNGKIKTFSIHDLLRDLCLRIAQKEKFLCVMSDLGIPPAIDGERRIVLHHPGYFHALRSASLARSLICRGHLQLSFKFRLLKVLNVSSSGSPDGIFEQVNLRYISYIPYCLSTLPSSISSLWNVQTLIFKGGRIEGVVVGPSEIWKMPQLRHLEFDEIYLLDPPSDPADQQDDFVLRNLQTLLTVVDFRLSEEVCKRIPNVKKLFLKYYNFPARLYYYCLCNLGSLQKLESLNCTFKKMPNRGDLLQNLTFPSSLQKLSLTNCRLHWEDLTMIGSLPHLEVLKLGWNSFTGHEWNPIEGEFLRLKFLSIHACSDLIYWNADSSHFPVLKNLVLDFMYQLDEIPSGIGEIPTLRFIRLVYCSMSAAISAMQILEEQESLGYEGLRVRVKIWDKEDLESLREKVELESFTSNNFQLEVAFP